MKEFSFIENYEEVLSSTKEKVKIDKQIRFNLLQKMQNLLLYLNYNYNLSFKFNYLEYNFEIEKYKKWHSFSYDKNYIYYNNKKLISTRESIVVQANKVNNIIKLIRWLIIAFK